MNNFDQQLLLWLNGDAGATADALWHIVSDRLTWVPLYVLLFALVWWRRGWRYALLFVGFCGVGVALTDQLCNLFKNSLQFLRPTHTLAIADSVHTVGGYVGGLYGTVSAHAANSTVVFITAGRALHSRHYWAPMSVWLVAVCYSRIYLGVHFPSQILFGLVLGTLAGLLMAWLTALIDRRYALTRERSRHSDRSDGQ